MSYRKIGGLHFLRIGRFGLSWFWSRRKPMTTKKFNEWADVPSYHPDHFDRYVVGDR